MSAGRRALLGSVASLAGLALLGALMMALALRAPQPLPAPGRGVSLGRVFLVEPGVGRRGPVSLRVEGGRIAAIGPPLDSADAFDGLTVLPGLSDMHAHLPPTGLPGDAEFTALLFLRHGVTRVRLTGGADPEALAALRGRIAAGALPGPHFHGCGPILDGPDPVVPGARVVADAEEAGGVVEELAARGVDCIKAYDRLDLDTTQALREAAHRQGLPLIGHTPQGLSLEAARLDDVQHLRGVHPPFRDERLDYPHFLRAWHRLDEAWLSHVVEVSLRQGMAHTPTLVAIQGTVVGHAWESWQRSPGMQLWLPHLRDGLWSGEVGFNPGRFASAADVDMVREAMRQMARALRALHAAGVPLHTGSDANVPNVVPGPSLHRELRLWADAGIDPEAALAASTRVSPEFLGVPGAGQLRAGAPADLLLLRGDPTRDLAALDGLVAVVSDGRLYTRQDLDTRLARRREHHQGLAYRRFFLPLLRGALSALTAWLREPAAS